MYTDGDLAAVERDRYRDYCALLLALVRTPAGDPAYGQLQARCRLAAQDWQDTHDALRAAGRGTPPAGVAVPASPSDDWRAALPQLRAMADALAVAD